MLTKSKDYDHDFIRTQLVEQKTEIINMNTHKTAAILAALGAGYGYRKAPDDDKVEGMARGALVGGSTALGGGLGAGLGHSAASMYSSEHGMSRAKLQALLTAIGLVGGGATGYVGSKALLGKPSYKDKDKSDK